MEHAPKINKVEVRTLQMADYRQLSQSLQEFIQTARMCFGHVSKSRS